MKRNACSTHQQPAGRQTLRSAKPRPKWTHTRRNKTFILLPFRKECTRLAKKTAGKRVRARIFPGHAPRRLGEDGPKQPLRPTRRPAVKESSIRLYFDLGAAAPDRSLRSMPKFSPRT